MRTGPAGSPRVPSDLELAVRAAAYAGPLCGIRQHGPVALAVGAAELVAALTPADLAALARWHPGLVDRARAVGVLAPRPRPRPFRRRWGPPSVEPTGTVRATLVALAAAPASASPVEVRASDGRAYRIPDVLLHSDQGVYRPNGAQQPFRRGARSYVIVRRVTVPPTGLRMVLVDEQVRCGGSTLKQLLQADLIEPVADGYGYVLTAAGWEAAERARCACAHPSAEHAGRRAADPGSPASDGGVCPCCARREAGLTQTLLGPA